MYPEKGGFNLRRTMGSDFTLFHRREAKTEMSLNQKGPLSDGTAKH